MRLLLDTHALIWWWTDNPRLPSTARRVIADGANTVIVSAVSAWEVAIKCRRGGWPEAARFASGFSSHIERSGFVALPVKMDHAQLAGSIVSDHKDPFDRMLAAQARIEGVPVVTVDPAFRQLGVAILW